jgi:hypothetical protein
MPVVRISDELFKEVQKYAEPLVDNFETALWKALRSRGPGIAAGNEHRSRGLELTPRRDFWKPLLEALVERGGQASREEMHKVVEKKMSSRLKPGDYEPNRDGTTKWSKHLDYERLAMVHEGLIERNSPRGIWQITDKGRQWLSQS